MPSQKKSSKTKAVRAAPGKPNEPVRDVTFENGLWMVTGAEGNRVRAPMLREGFPGGEEAYERLRHASSRVQSLVGKKKAPELSEHDRLGIVTERDHFRFAKIIGESRVLKDKGLHREASANLEHARKILDEVNERRNQLGLGPLTGKEFLSYQRPLTTAELAQILRTKILKQNKRKVQRRLLRTLLRPEEKLIQQLRVRIQQLEKEEMAPNQNQRNEIARLLKRPAQEILRVMNDRVRQLALTKKSETEKIDLKMVARKKEPLPLTIITPAERFARKPKWVQRSLLTLLSIAQNAVAIEQNMLRRRDTVRARKAAKTYDEAMRVFSQLFRNGE